MAHSLASTIEIGLTAAIVTVVDDDPEVLIVANAGDLPRLPAGPFDPLAHRTFEIGLRTWVAEQTDLPLGYAEQLYTFGDRGRHASPADRGPHVVSVGYLALVRIAPRPAPRAGPTIADRFRSWYRFLPWEDWRGGRPTLIDAEILPLLRVWAEEEAAGRSQRPLSRAERIRLCFGDPGATFDDEKVLERYELMYEAGLVEEAARDEREAALKRGQRPALGMAMAFDHRRILATAMGRLRAKVRYRPVIFELMPPRFTLTDLQRAAEAIAGRHLHTQNFRRFVETTQLVEPTGAKTTTRGRPAALFRFRREVLIERPAPGLRVGPRG